LTIQQDGELRLCPVTADEFDTYAHFMTHGEWRHFDVPWQGVWDEWEPEALAQFRKQFLATAARQDEAVSKCTIYLSDDPIGWMNSYDLSFGKAAVKVGICICVDECLGKGLGTRSLRLWVRYWFEQRKLHRVGLDTWSINPRMMHVARKCGFVPEGVEREVEWWEGAWRDLHHFGMTEGDHTRAMERPGTGGRE
jgi:RimJ/RimL family protein N-acetyltransferase